MYIVTWNNKNGEKCQKAVFTEVGARLTAEKLAEEYEDVSVSEDRPDPETVVNALRHCSERVCTGCPYSGMGIACKYILMSDAVSVIEAG